MATLRKRGRSPEAPPSPNHHQTIENGKTPETHIVSGYEQFREERIKENLERMQKLGIFDLSLKLKSLKPTPKNTQYNHRVPHRLSPLPSPGPVRRSSRLQNVTPVSYSEVHLTRKDESLGSEDVVLREGFKPEAYTEEHEKLLGNTEMSWTLFVDGYGKDGKRIYDQDKGKTCHQCRQKTLGHRTHCSRCNMVQGQFCGDCLYMRYGEHVLEAKQNPEWICPVCRGICNCSLCRKAKGWPATGSLYKKISNLGFKSVAHYLIQTRRSNTDSEKNLGTNIPVSAKRSLPFSDMEAMSEEKSPDSNNNLLQQLVKPESEENKTEDDFNGEKAEEMHLPEEDYVAPESIPEPAGRLRLPVESGDNHQGLLKPKSEDRPKVDEFEEKKEKQMHSFNNKRCDSNAVPESSPETIKKRVLAIESSCPVAKRKTPLATELMPNSIAGRLRLRRSKGHGQDNVELIRINKETFEAKLDVKSVSLERQANANLNCSSSTSPSIDSIAGRLKVRHKRT